MEVNTNCDILRYDGLNHWVFYDDKDDKPSRSRCALATCKFFTHLFCSKCGKHLCMTSTRNCFYAYHCRPTELTYKKKSRRRQNQNKKTVAVKKKPVQKSIDLKVNAENSDSKPHRSRKQVQNVIKIQILGKKTTKVEKKESALRSAVPDSNPKALSNSLIESAIFMNALGLRPVRHNGKRVKLIA